MDTVNLELESSVQQRVMDFLNDQKYTKIVKVLSATVSGVSDILVCHKGRFIAIEVKRDPLYEPDPLQVIFLNDVIDAGGQAITTSTVAVVSYILNNPIAGKTKFKQTKTKDFKDLL